MNSEDERHKVARRLRALPTDLYDTLCELKAQGLYIDATLQDELDYSLIHNVLLGCFPAEHMHPGDYEELHERLADLIDPTCHTSVMGYPNKYRVYKKCSACNTTWLEDVYNPLYNYCPSCGARIVEEK